MRKLVHAGLYLERLRTLKYSLTTGGGGEAYQADAFCTFCSPSCLAAEGAEAASSTSESEYYRSYSDFSGTTPAHISPSHSQIYIYAWVTGARR